MNLECRWCGKLTTQYWDANADRWKIADHGHCIGSGSTMLPSGQCEPNEKYRVAPFKQNVPEEEKVEPMTEGISDREKLIRTYGFSFDSDRDACRYLLGVIDTLRWDRKLLRDRESEREAKPAPKQEGTAESQMVYIVRPEFGLVLQARTVAGNDADALATAMMWAFDLSPSDALHIERRPAKPALIAAEIDRLQRLGNLDSSATPAPEEPKVCALCGSPAEYSPEEGVWRHDLKHSPIICDKYGYPIEVRAKGEKAAEEPKKRYRQGAGNPAEVIDNENSIWVAKCHNAIDAERIVQALNQMEERG